MVYFHNACVAMIDGCVRMQACIGQPESILFPDWTDSLYWCRRGWGNVFTLVQMREIGIVVELMLV